MFKGLAKKIIAMIMAIICIVMMSPSEARAYDDDTFVESGDIARNGSDEAMYRAYCYKENEESMLGISYDYKWADIHEYYKKEAESVHIPDFLGDESYEVKIIGGGVFAECSATKIEIPDSVEYIGGYAFSDCKNLVNINIPEGVKRIYTATFKGCEKLEEINIPKNVEYLEAEAFGGCSSLSSITIPSSVEEIDERVFENCTGLESVVIEDASNIESFDGSAFSGCTNINSIEIKNATDIRKITTILNAISTANSEATTIKVPEAHAVDVKKEYKNSRVFDNSGKEYYSVSFNTNEHGTAPDSIVVESGSKISSPTDNPAEYGYTLEGWYKEVECENEWVFDTDVITEDITLYAKWIRHTGASKWTKSDDKHWHECATEGCEEKFDEADHSWDAGVVTKEPTEAEEGVKLYTCKVCEATRTEPIEKLTHKAKSEWKKDANTHWHECENCDGKLEEAAHTWDLGAVTKESTLLEEGVKTYTCTICGQTKEESIEIHVHDEVVDLYVAPTCETAGKSAGSHCSICGTVIKAQKEIAALDHKLSEGVITKAATADEKGIMTYTCTRTGCTHKIEKIIPTIKVSEDVVGEDVEILNPENPLTDTTINVIGVKDVTYTGSAVTFDLRVYVGKTLLKEGTDYSVKYLNNKTVPVADTSGTIADTKKPQLVITGKGIYKDKEVYKFNPVYFDINPVNIEELEKTGDLVVSNEVVLAAKNKKLVKPVPTITINGKKLNKKDYTVSYGASNEAGIDASVVGKTVITLTGKGNYTGSVTSVYEVVANPAVDKTASPVVLMSKASITGMQKSIAYAGGDEVKQNGYTVKAKVGKTNTVLTEGKDYTVAYTDNREIGTASMIIKAKAGNDKGLVGEKVVAFKITGTAMSKLTYTYDNKVDYTGTTIKPGLTGQPKLTIIDKTDKQNPKTLHYGTDYEIQYLKNVQAGTATMLITGKGFYAGTVKKTFMITAVDLGKNTGIKAELVAGSVNKETEGKLKNKYTAKVLVTYKGKELKEGKDYTLSYKNNSKPGLSTDGKKAPTVVIKGKGNYTKTKSLTFYITE